MSTLSRLWLVRPVLGARASSMRVQTSAQARKAVEAGLKSTGGLNL